MGWAERRARCGRRLAIRAGTTPDQPTASFSSFRTTSHQGRKAAPGRTAFYEKESFREPRPLFRGAVASVSRSGGTGHLEHDHAVAWNRCSGVSAAERSEIGVGPEITH